MGDGETPAERPERPSTGAPPAAADRRLRLDALPENLASPVFKSFARSAAIAAGREIAHKLFQKAP